MKKSFAVIVAVATLALVATAGNALAKGKEVTLTGEAKCAKCALHEGKTCQTVIQVEKNGKTHTYYVVANDVSKGFHKQVCSDTKKVTATGTVKKVAGKQELVLTKIELAQ